MRGAIFDLDGVITNSVPLHFKAWKKMFAEYNVNFSFEDYKNKVDGRPRLEGAKAILTSLSNEELLKASDKKQAYFLEFLETDGVETFPSSVNLLKNMKKAKIKLACASSSKNAGSIIKKTNLDKIFDINVSGQDFKMGKPHPEIFLTAAKRLNLSPEECVVFEDASSGVQAAINGNFFCVGIDRNNQKELLQGADIIVNDLSEISLEKIKEIFDGKERKKHVH